MSFADEIGSLTKSDTIKLFAGVLDAVFSGLDMIFKASGALKLSTSEAKELAEKIVEALPKKSNKDFDKFLKKHAPIVNLILVSGAIVYPRVYFIYEQRNKALGSAAGGDRVQGGAASKESGRVVREQNGVDAAAAYYQHLFGED